MESCFGSTNQMEVNLFIREISKPMCSMDMERLCGQTVISMKVNLKTVNTTDRENSDGLILNSNTKESLEREKCMVLVYLKTLMEFSRENSVLDILKERP